MERASFHPSWPLQSHPKQKITPRQLFKDQTKRKRPVPPNSVSKVLNSYFPSRQARNKQQEKATLMRIFLLCVCVCTRVVRSQQNLVKHLDETSAHSHHFISKREKKRKRKSTENV